LEEVDEVVGSASEEREAEPGPEAESDVDVDVNDAVGPSWEEMEGPREEIVREGEVGGEADGSVSWGSEAEVEGKGEEGGRG
jgi:hypothetical protein